MACQNAGGECRAPGSGGRNTISLGGSICRLQCRIFVAWRCESPKAGRTRPELVLIPEKARIYYPVLCHTQAIFCTDLRYFVEYLTYLYWSKTLISPTLFILYFMFHLLRNTPTTSHRPFLLRIPRMYFVLRTLKSREVCKQILQLCSALLLANSTIFS